jgi:hypothetical protein
MPTRAERIEALYAQVPPIPDCRGHCWVSCGPADISPWELKRLREAGHPITPNKIASNSTTEFWCEALGPDGKCRAYVIRPLLCRIWGAVSWLPCPHGCQPEGGWMRDADALRLIFEVTRLGGTGIPVTDEDFAHLDDPAWVAAMTRGLTAIESYDYANARARAYGTALPVAITSRPQ